MLPLIVKSQQLKILPECPIITTIRHKYDMVINPMSNTIHVEIISNMIIHLLVACTYFFSPHSIKMTQ